MLSAMQHHRKTAHILARPLQSFGTKAEERERQLYQICSKVTEKQKAHRA